MDDSKNKLNTPTVELIEQRESKLQEACAYLKSQFVGLDDVIDAIINDIRIWYIMPDLIIRPVIVNLWGMTGTGKTDLVRKLVAFLQMDDRFVDIQMDSPIRGSGEDCTKYKSVNEALEYSGIDSNNANIILLDEFQRAKTISTAGDTIERELFNDVWMLLSDGKFVKVAAGGRNYIDRLKLEVDDYFMALMYDSSKKKTKKRKKISRLLNRDIIDDDDYECEDESDEPEFVPKIKHSSWYISNIKTKLKLPKSEFELMQMDSYDLNTYIKKHIDENEQKILQGADYSKSLIFICGNLDNAYSMARGVSDADSDADILHEYSKRISIIDIKRCLSLLFKPEQIARLGNSHVIYPCLNRENYTQLIHRNLNQYLSNIYNSCNVEITYNDRVVQKLYKNYVYPSQGVRPLYSSIGSFISNTIPRFLLNAIRNNLKSFNIDICDEEYVVCTYSNGESIRIQYNFELDKIKKYIDIDKLMLYAVHESAHALVYAELFGYAPKLINIELTDHDGAYIIPNDMFHSKQTMINMIMVYLAGSVAESLVFGSDNICAGSASDIKEATKYAALMIRKYGMGPYIGNIDAPVDDSCKFSITDIDSTNEDLKAILKDCQIDVLKLIRNKLDILIKIINVVFDRKKISGRSFVDIVKDEYPSLKCIDPLDDIGYHTITPKYFDLFNDIITKNAQNTGNI